MRPKLAPALALAAAALLAQGCAFFVASPPPAETVSMPDADADAEADADADAHTDAGGDADTAVSVSDDVTATDISLPGDVSAGGG